MRLGTCLRFRLGSGNGGLGVVGRWLGASLGHAWFSLGRVRPAVSPGLAQFVVSLGRAWPVVGPVGPVSPGLARFVVSLGRYACTGRTWLRASIPGDSLTAAGAGAQVLGE